MYQRPLRFIVTATLVWTFCSASVFANNECFLARQEYTIESAADNVKQIVAEYPELVPLVQTWEKFRALAGASELGQLLPVEHVAQVVSNPTMLYYSKNFVALMSSAELGGPVNRQTVQQALERLLDGKVPRETVGPRIDALFNQPSLENVYRALGDMTMKEVQTLFYGESPYQPSPGSLIGQYIAETGAATLVRTFKTGPDAAAPQGEKRLVVAISQQSFEAFKRLFYRQEVMSVMGHADIFHGGKYQAFGGNLSDFALPGSENKIIPILLLKSTEAQRLAQFLLLDRQSGSWSNNEAQQPWRLEEYCAIGAYANCTQKIGNIPIGDKLVDAYTFPGAMDNYANNKIPGTAEENARPRTKPLQPYNHPKPLMKRVWSVPGHEQLADVIGQHEANIRGEFANPGWVITTLIGPTSSERVPFVFVIKPDHKAPIDPNFEPVFERPL